MFLADSFKVGTQFLVKVASLKRKQVTGVGDAQWEDSCTLCPSPCSMVLILAVAQGQPRDLPWGVMRARHCVNHKAMASSGVTHYGEENP